jgi:hypothetical protein
MKCPNCKTECDRDEVDIGVGIQHGPWQCNECGWIEIHKVITLVGVGKAFKKLLKVDI